MARASTQVLFLTHAFPRHEHDLPGNFLLRLAAALAAEGVTVRALAPSEAGLAPRAQLRGVEVRRYRYAPRRAETLAYHGNMHDRAASPTGAVALAGLLAAGALAARREAARADLVHAHWWFPGGLQALAARRRPLVVTLHGTDIRLARRLAPARAACARVLRAATLVTTVSTWLRDEAASIAPSCAPRLRVAPMPVDETAFQPGPPGAPRTELLFVGRLDGQKGLDVALRALARLEGAAARLPLRVVGSGPGEARFRQLAAELGVAGRVRWDPPLPQAELAARYRRAAALLVCGRDEGLGLVAVEGQLSGTPVVAASSGGLTDVVKDGATGRAFPPGDDRALARVIQELAERPEAAARLAEQARASALARFSTSAAARAYARLYAEALDHAAALA